MKAHLLKTALAALFLTGIAVTTASAGIINITTDDFGSGANAFSIDFADIGNALNGNDATGTSYTADGGLYGSGTTFGLGGVGYNYRMGVTEVSRDWLAKAGTPGGNPLLGSDLPAASITWYQAAAFVNYLNTSTGHQKAYNLDAGATALTLWQSTDAGYDAANPYRNANAFYFLPSESEWYKAAYHQNDGVTANFWDYPTASNSIPGAVASGTTAGTAVYNGQAGPANVTLAGGLSAYGTMGQGGNVFEWAESAFDGLNNLSSESRAFRGGLWLDSELYLRSLTRLSLVPSSSLTLIGFRVASVPEPTAVPEPSTVMVGVGLGLICIFSRRRRSSL